MQFGEESQERFPLPSRGGGSEGEEGASPQENRSALWKFITPHRGKTGVSVGGYRRYPNPPSSFKDDENKNGVSLIAPKRFMGDPKKRLPLTRWGPQTTKRNVLKKTE